MQEREERRKERRIIIPDWRGIVDLALLRENGIHLPDSFFLSSHPDISCEGVIEGQERVFRIRLEKWEKLKIEEIGVLQAPKPEKPRSGDCCLIKVYHTKDAVLIFVGDGITPAEPPHPAFEPILIRFDCVKTPDALPRKVLENVVVKKIQWIDQKPYEYDRSVKVLVPIEPVDFLRQLKEQWKAFYIQNGFSPEILAEIPPSQLPAMVGVCALITPQRVEIAAFGDVGVFVVDSYGNILPYLLPIQNQGVDRLTIEVINGILQRYPGLTVEEARDTEEFREWLIRSYNQKMGPDGEVPVMNGRDDPCQRLMKVSLPRPNLDGLVFATDGLVLGVEEQEIPPLIRSMISCSSVEALGNWLRRRIKEQRKGYSNRFPCRQEKPHDDLTAVYVKFARRPVPSAPPLRWET